MEYIGIDLLQKNLGVDLLQEKLGINANTFLKSEPKLDNISMCPKNKVRCLKRDVITPPCLSPDVDGRGYDVTFKTSDFVLIRQIDNIL